MPHTEKPERRSSRLNLRASPSEDALIRAGAEAAGLSMSDYLLTSACRQAEADLASRRQFALSPERMKAFLEALDRPVEAKPRLRRLFAEPDLLSKE